MNDELRDLNEMARKLLEYLHSWAVRVGGRPFSISPHDPDTLTTTGLDGETYMKAASWLVRKSLAKWHASGGSMTITEYGIQVAEDAGLLDHELPTQRATSNSENRTMAMSADKKKVFIIHGRNMVARVAVEHFLKALKLEPLDFDALAGDMPSEFVGNIVLEGLKRAHGIVILFTPDEYAALCPGLRETSEADAKRWQSRPNVIFEAGIAFGAARERCTLVTMGSEVSLFSDIRGVHIVRLDNREASRKSFRQKLIGMGCDVDLRADSFTDPARSGDFEAPVAGVCELKPVDPFGTPTVVAAVPAAVGDEEALALAKSWLRTRPAKSASFTYEDINKTLPVAVRPDVLRRLLPQAAQETNWELAAHEHSVTLTFHIPGPIVAGGSFAGF
jgi:predicted nucleotide-binding protein